jgi:hypothetical protein
MVTQLQDSINNFDITQLFSFDPRGLEAQFFEDCSVKNETFILFKTTRPFYLLKIPCFPFQAGRDKVPHFLVPNKLRKNWGCNYENWEVLARQILLNGRSGN